MKDNHTLGMIIPLKADLRSPRNKLSRKSPLVRLKSSVDFAAVYQRLVSRMTFRPLHG